MARLKVGYKIGLFGNSLMHQSGITTDDRPVLAGVFPLFGTHGLPLDIILAELNARGLVVDWPDYVAGALSDGHKPPRIRSRIVEAVEDVMGTEVSREVGKRLDLLFARV